MEPSPHDSSPRDKASEREMEPMSSQAGPLNLYAVPRQEHAKDAADDDRGVRPSPTASRARLSPGGPPSTHATLSPSRSLAALAEADVEESRAKPSQGQRARPVDEDARLELSPAVFQRSEDMQTYIRDDHTTAATATATVPVSPTASAKPGRLLVGSCTSSGANSPMCISNSVYSRLVPISPTVSSETQLHGSTMHLAAGTAGIGAGVYAGGRRHLGTGGSPSGSPPDGPMMLVPVSPHASSSSSRLVAPPPPRTGASPRPSAWVAAPPSTTSPSSRCNSVPRSYANMSHGSVATTPITPVVASTTTTTNAAASAMLTDDKVCFYTSQPSSFTLPALTAVGAGPASRGPASPNPPTLSTLDGAPAMRTRGSSPTPSGSPTVPSEREPISPRHTALSSRVRSPSHRSRGNAWMDSHKVVNAFYTIDRDGDGDEPRAGTAGAVLTQGGNLSDRSQQRGRLDSLFAGSSSGSGGGGTVSTTYAQTPKAPASAHSSRFHEQSPASQRGITSEGRRQSAAAANSSARVGMGNLHSVRWPTARPHFLSSMSPSSSSSGVGPSGEGAVVVASRAPGASAEGSLTEAGLFCNASRSFGRSGAASTSIASPLHGLAVQEGSVSFSAAGPAATGAGGGGRQSVSRSPCRLETPSGATHSSSDMAPPSQPVLPSTRTMPSGEPGQSEDGDVQEVSFRSASATPLLAQSAGAFFVASAFGTDGIPSFLTNSQRMSLSGTSDIQAKTLAPRSGSKESTTSVGLGQTPQASSRPSSTSPPAHNMVEVERLSDAFMLSDEWRSPFRTMTTGTSTTTTIPGASASATLAPTSGLHEASPAAQPSHAAQVSHGPFQDDKRPSIASSSISLSAAPMYTAAHVNGDDEEAGRGASIKRFSAPNASHSMPPPPWTPQEALLHHGRHLTPFEKEEIVNYPHIYYCGERAVRLGLKHPESSAAATTFDEDDHHYRVIIGDHIAYRYEVVDVLGYGTYSVVVRVIDHASDCHPRRRSSFAPSPMVAQRSNSSATGTTHTVTGSTVSGVIPPSPPPSSMRGPSRPGTPPPRLTLTSPPAFATTTTTTATATAGSGGQREHAVDGVSKPRVLAMKIIRNDPQYTAVAEEEMQLHEQLKQSFKVQRRESFRVLKGAVSSESHGLRRASVMRTDGSMSEVAPSPRKRRAPEVTLASFEKAEARLKQDAEQGRCTLSQLITHFSFRQHLILVFPLFGMDLGELLRINSRQPFPILITRSFTAQVVHALASVRRAGILHADIKPENILLVDRSEEDAELPTFSSCIARLREGEASLDASAGGCRVVVHDDYDDGTEVEGGEYSRASRTAGTHDGDDEEGGSGAGGGGGGMGSEVCTSHTTATSRTGGDRNHSHYGSSPPPPPHSNSVTALPVMAEVMQLQGSTDDGMAADALYQVQTGSQPGSASVVVVPVTQSRSPTPPPPLSLGSGVPDARTAAATAAGYSESSAGSKVKLVRRGSVGRVTSRITLIDFSNARPADSEHCLYPIQSQFYRSPEAALRLHYDERMDMWSLGCILYELVTGHTLFPVNSDVELLEQALEVLGMPDRAFLDRIKAFWKAYRASHPSVAPIRSDVSPSRPVTASPDAPVHDEAGTARSEDEVALEMCWQALLHMLNRKAAAAQAQQSLNSSSASGSRSRFAEDTLVSLLTQLGETDLLLGDDDVDSDDLGERKRHTATRGPSGTEELVVLLLDFLFGCLYWDADMRLHPEEAMRHPFLSVFFVFPKNQRVGGHQNKSKKPSHKTQCAAAHAAGEATPTVPDEGHPFTDGAEANEEGREGKAVAVVAHNKVEEEEEASRTSGLYFLRRHTLTAHRPYLLSRAALYARARDSVSVHDDAATGDDDDDDEALDEGDDQAQVKLGSGGRRSPAVHARTQPVTHHTRSDEDDAEAVHLPCTPLSRSGSSLSSSSCSSCAASAEPATVGAQGSRRDVPLPILCDAAVFFPLAQPPLYLPGEERFQYVPAEPFDAELARAEGACVDVVSPPPAIPLPAVNANDPTATDLFLQDLVTPVNASLHTDTRCRDSPGVTPVWDHGRSLLGSDGRQTPSSRSHSTQSSPALARTLPTRHTRLFYDGAAVETQQRCASIAGSICSPSALLVPPSSLHLTTSTNATSLHHQINQQVLRSATATPREARPLPVSMPPPGSGVLLSDQDQPQVLHLSGPTQQPVFATPSPPAVGLNFD